MINHLMKVYRYNRAINAVYSGKVESWIKEIIGDTPYEYSTSLFGAVYTLDDASKIYFTFNSMNVVTLLQYKCSFKETIQNVAAHEMGHVVDEQHLMLQTIIRSALEARDFDTYYKTVMLREERAFKLGLPFAKNPKSYEAFNLHNLELYEQILARDKTLFISREA